MSKIICSEAYRIAHSVNQKYFGLKMPIVVKITKAKKFNSKFAAMWTLKHYVNIFEDDTAYHEIKLSCDCVLDYGYFQESIIHELVHAEQHEKGIFDTPHNRAFFSRLDYVLAQCGLPATSPEYRQAIKKY